MGRLGGVEGAFQGRRRAAVHRLCRGAHRKVQLLRVPAGASQRWRYEIYVSMLSIFIAAVAPPLEWAELIEFQDITLYGSVFFWYFFLAFAIKDFCH